MNIAFNSIFHDDVIEWKHSPHYWPFVRRVHLSPVNSPHKGQWRGALIFYLICVWINGWVNNREAGDLRRYLAHYDVIVILCRMVQTAIPWLILKFWQFVESVKTIEITIFREFGVWFKFQLNIPYSNTNVFIAGIMIMMHVIIRVSKWITSWRCLSKYHRYFVKSLGI